jgi:hypothetical protein
MGLRVVLSLFLFLLWSLEVFAYIPPSAYILKSWVTKHGGVKSIRIKTTVTAMENDKPTGIQFRENTLYIADKMLLKSFATDGSEKKLFFIEKSGVSLSPVSKLLFSSDLKDVARVLKDRKIPIKTEDELLTLRTEAERIKVESTSFGRLGNSIAWVIGPPTTRDNSQLEPQIWFEKDTFLPLRFVYTDPSTQEDYDIRFDGYRFQKEFPYPRTLSMSKKGKSIFVASQLIEMSANSDQGSFRQVHSSRPEGTFTEAGQGASSDVKDLIRRYYEIIR